MRQLANVGPAAAHALKPGSDHQPERLGRAEKPAIDFRASANRAGEPHQIVHAAMMPTRPPRDTRGFFHRWIAPGGTASAEQMGDGFFEIERSYWAERARENLLLVHYADLKADLDGEMRRISGFLDIPVDEAIWPTLVEAADFESMKRAGADLMPGAELSFEGGHTTFLNKGTNGRWQADLTQDDLALYDRRMATELSPALARWLEHGRLVAGDPETAAD